MPIVITLAAVASAAALLWLWWWVPKWQMRSITAADPKARADIEDNFRKTMGQLIGGAAVLIGAGLAYLQFSQQQQAAQQQFSQQQQAAHELLISNQVARGFEQLGSDKVVGRLGGIYALEGVMNTSEQYQKPVLEALSAFVRDSTRTGIEYDPPATDVQAALTVIGRRHPLSIAAPDLSHARMPGADLNNADLAGANLADADLVGAWLWSANLWFANLFGADLVGAHLIQTYLNHAELQHAKLTFADLSLADLSDADLRHALIDQRQLDQACGTNVKLDPGLTIKPCP